MKQEIFISFVVVVHLHLDVALGKKHCECSVDHVGSVYCPVSFLDVDYFDPVETLVLLRVSGIAVQGGCELRW